jgi:hypothetical protein
VPPSPPDTPPPPEATLSGTVKEHVEVAQYTYLRLATDGGEAWAAVYRAPVKDGTAVTVQRAVRLAGFHSRELNRDFDAIWFGVLPGHEAAPAESASATAPAPAASASAAGLPLPKGAMAIADLAKNAASLEGKQVTVAGHVVKETDQILGRNWIHLQDGTGDPADKSNDVLVTTEAGSPTHALGEEVVATGTVRTKQDFGAGYAYAFLLEKAALSPRTR